MNREPDPVIWWVSVLLILGIIFAISLVGEDCRARKECAGFGGTIRQDNRSKRGWRCDRPESLVAPPVERP